MSSKRKAMSAHRGYAKYSKGYAIQGARPELKFKDSTKTATAIDDGGTVLDTSDLLLVPQNNTQSGRNGRKICVKSVHIQGECRLYPQAIKTDDSHAQSELFIDRDLAQQYVRVVLLADHQTNGSDATIAQIYNSNDILTFRNLENSKRFTVLKEKKVKLTRTPAAALNSNDSSKTTLFYPMARQQWKMNVKMSMEIDYNSTDGIVTERTQNNLVLVAFCDGDNAEFGSRVEVRYLARVRYLDF